MSPITAFHLPAYTHTYSTQHTTHNTKHTTHTALSAPDLCARTRADARSDSPCCVRKVTSSLSRRATGSAVGIETTLSP
eukprot:1225328-Rhodomonas_salina.3